MSSGLLFDEGSDTVFLFSLPFLPGTKTETESIFICKLTPELRDTTTGLLIDMMR